MCESCLSDTLVQPSSSPGSSAGGATIRERRSFNMIMTKSHATVHASPCRAGTVSSRTATWMIHCSSALGKERSERRAPFDTFFVRRTEPAGVDAGGKKKGTSHTGCTQQTVLQDVQQAVRLFPRSRDSAEKNPYHPNAVRSA